MAGMRQLLWVVAAGALLGCSVSKPSDEERTDMRDAPLSPGSALFVVGNTALSAADNVMSQRLQTLGFTVVVKSDTAGTTSDATGKSLVVISSTSTSGNVGTKFKSVAVPVLSWESGILDDMGMVASSSNLGIATGQTRANIVAASSDPMSVGLSGSQQVVTTASTFSWGQPATQAVVVARLDTDATKAVLFRYEKGSTMVGLNAPERRVGVFLEDVTSSALNGAGQSLIDAAIRWAAYVTPICTPGATQCSGNIAQTCSASGQWTTTATCPGACTSGACVGVCTPGATQCSGNIAQTCSASGQWTTTATCPGACTSGVCVGVCTPGALQCSGNIAQTCSTSGQWTTTATCPGACTSGVCVGVCTPGALQCSGNIAQTCSSSGQWTSTATCPSTCSGGTCVGVCTPGATRCIGQAVQACSAGGVWGTAIMCSM